MKKILFAATFALFASTQAFAIIGVGAHYIMNTGSLGASKGEIQSLGLTVNQEKSDGLKGIGFKLWIDFLPFVDVEGTFNIAAARYRTSLEYPGLAPIYLEYTPEAPYSMIFGKASPIYGIATGDISITYPFDVLPIIRPYIGTGLSYFMSTPVVNKAFVEKVPDIYKQSGNIVQQNNDISDDVIKALKESDYETGIGGHIIAGVRIKTPAIPVAIYTNGKYYFGGNTDSKFTQGFVLEVGGGFAL